MTGTSWNRGVTGRGTGFSIRRASGPVVLLSCSLGAIESSWAEVVAALPRDWTILTYDHRGHGRSRYDGGSFEFDDLVADALAVLDAASVERAHWCGVSLGGMVGVAAAGAAPNRVASLTALSTPAWQESPEFWRARADAVVTAGMSVAADGVAGRWFSPDFRERHPDRVAELVADIQGLDPAGYAATCRAMAPADVRNVADGLGLPTVLVASSGDLAVPARHSSDLASRIHGARLVETVGGHMVGVEHADLVAALMAEQVAA